jgi:hypothetical protein
LQSWNYGLNAHSHFNLIFDFGFVDFYACTYLFNAQLFDFSPILARLSVSRFDATTSNPGFHAYFNLERELYVARLVTIVDENAYTGIGSLYEMFFKEE